MSPKLQALKAALDRLDGLPIYSHARKGASAAVTAAAYAAGFDPNRAVDDWARYQVAVAEAQDQAADEEPEPESGELFA